jgi:hypothetical protein
MSNDSNISSKAQIVLHAIEKGDARLLAIIIKRDLRVSAGEDGLTLPSGNYALIALPDTKRDEGVYLVREAETQS